MMMVRYNDRIWGSVSKLDSPWNPDKAYYKIEAETPGEIATHFQRLSSLRSTLDKTSESITTLNEEEVMLGMPETAYPDLLDNIQNIQPFMLLWGTADSFINQSETWLNGPFRVLDPETMTEEVETMWRTLHKSVKTFNDNPQPRKGNFELFSVDFRSTSGVKSFFSGWNNEEKDW